MAKWAVSGEPARGTTHLKFPKVRSLAWSPLVHRTLSSGAPDSLVRQTRAAFGYPLLFLLNPFLGLFIG
jgi:hypothetical protein